MGFEYYHHSIQDDALPLLKTQVHTCGCQTCVVLLVLRLAFQSSPLLQGVDIDDVCAMHDDAVESLSAAAMQESLVFSQQFMKVFLTIQKLTCRLAVTRNWPSCQNFEDIIT